MRKGKTVIGQGVYSLADGTRVQSVKDLLINEQNDAIIALLVDEGGLLGTSTVVPIEAVRVFGPSAVLIEDAQAVIAAANDPRVSDVLGRKVSLLGTRVISTEGEELGTIGDMYFDERSGQIQGYEVSGGRVGDVMRGTSYLSIDEIKVVGPDAVIATEGAKDIVESQVGGIAGALQAAQAGLQSAGATAADSGSPPDVAAAPDPVASDPDGRLVGRRVTVDLIDERGSVVVANGQRVTLAHVQRARAEGNLDPLYQAAGIERPVPLGEQASQAADKVAQGASDLWSRFTSKLSEMTDAAGQRVDTQQSKGRLDAINDAIGRPVTKVFLDRDDDVILDLGDLVTHQAIQRAHEAGMLDSMLSSVYKADVTFERDEMRAQVAGDSTIEQATGGATVVEELESRIEAAAAPSPEPEAAKQPVDGPEDKGGEPQDEAAANEASSRAPTKEPRDGRHQPARE